MTNSNTICIKSADIFIGLMTASFHPKLIEIAMLVIDLIQNAGISVCITSAYRPNDEGSVHKYGRGLDFRTWDMSPDFIAELCDEINQIWTYDHDRREIQCLIYHDTGRGPHLHLQVCDKTKKSNAV